MQMHTAAKTMTKTPTNVEKSQLNSIRTSRMGHFFFEERGFSIGQSDGRV